MKIHRKKLKDTTQSSFYPKALQPADQPPDERGKSVWAAIRFVALMAVLTLLARGTTAATIPQVKVDTPRAGEITQSCIASGIVEPSQTQSIQLPENIAVQQVFVEVGQEVKTGDVLLTFSTDSLQEQIETTRINRQTLVAQQNELTAGETQARTNNVTDARLALQRAQEDRDLLKTNPDADESVWIAADRAVQDAEMALQRAEDDYKENQTEIAASNAVSQAQRRSLQQQIDKADEELTKLETLLDTGGQVLAPMDGTITELSAIVGEACDPSALQMAPSDSASQMTISLDTQQAALLSSSTTVQVAQGSIQQPGTVQTITRQQDTTLVTVSLPAAGWAYTSADAEFQFSSMRYDNCLPLSALHQDTSGWYIFLVQQQTSILGIQDVLVSVPVTVLDRNDTMAAIEGVSMQATVAVSSNKALHAGDTVKVMQNGG